MKPPPSPARTLLTTWGPLVAGLLAFFLVTAYAPQPIPEHFTVLMLSIVIGYYVIGKVHHALHTPLMSVTNAISGIIVVGAMLQIGLDDPTIVALSSLVAVLLASSTWGSTSSRPHALSLSPSPPDAQHVSKADRHVRRTVSRRLLRRLRGYLVAALLFILSLAGSAGTRPPATASRSASPEWRSRSSRRCGSRSTSPTSPTPARCPSSCCSSRC